MNTSLRHALEDLAERQAFTPDPSVWDRGRRARRRDRTLLVAAVLVLVAALGGIGVLVDGHSSTPGAAGGGDGWVPAQL
ncbi:MAG: hypothetical protein LT071_01125, partial [Nocardioides sp.]|nr:hypothetical protein [Nocardioides sp.]